MHNGGRLRPSTDRRRARQPTYLRYGAHREGRSTIDPTANPPSRQFADRVNTVEPPAHGLNIRVVTSGWALSRRQANTIVLERKRPVCGWHRIEVYLTGEHASGAQGILARPAPRLAPIPLVAKGHPGCFELFFYSRHPVSELRLEFRPDSATAHEARIAVTPISGLRAAAAILRHISDRDRDKNSDPSRIYRKSWARWRRHGWDGFLLRLIREYQPQLVQWMHVQDPYQTWIENVEAPSRAATLQCSHASDLTRLPEFELIVCGPDATAQELCATIDSILMQHYPKWTLSIDSTNLSCDARQAACEYLDKDPRIVLTREEGSRKHRGPHSDSRFVGTVDCGDTLPTHALMAIALQLQTTPHAKVIYSDHDEIDGSGLRSNPYFKPDWNPDLFLSQDYIRHLCLYRADLLHAAHVQLSEGNSTSAERILFQCLPLLSDKEITRVPKVLYHRRKRPHLKHRDQLAATTAGIQVRQHYFSATGRAGISVEPATIPGTYRIRYPLPDRAPLVSLLIPTRDKRTLLETCVRSILDKTTYPNYEIIILDNQSSSPDTIEFFESIARQDRRVRTIRYDYPFNYSAVNNFGVAHARGELIGLINNDIEVITPDWLTEMVSHACRPEIGCVGAKLYYSNDTIQHGGVITGLWGVAGHAHKHLDRRDPGYQGRAMCAQNFSAVTGACLLVRRELYKAIGGLDEEHLPVSFNDVDFCLKIREAGYRNLWTPYAELYHHESISRGPDDSPEKKAREKQEIEYMKARWGGTLSPDPCYNPNLTHHMENFSINIDMILFPHLIGGIDRSSGTAPPTTPP